MAYYNRMREAREDHDLSQRAIAELIGITQQQYQLYESGKRTIPVEKLRLFCKELKVSADYILELPKGLKWER